MQGGDRTAQVLAVTRGGGLYHAEGSWSGFGEVGLGHRGPVAGTVGAVVADRLHAVAVTKAGGLLHAVRRPGGAWGRFADVKSHTGNPGVVADVAATPVDGGLALVVRTATGGVFGTTRREDGSWAGLAYLKGLAGDPGFVTDLAVAAADGGLHVLVATNRRRLCHAIRLPDGSWRPFRDVGPHDGRVAAAGVGGEVHVLAHTPERVRHLTWRADGTWSDGVDVRAPTPVADLAATDVRGDLHVLATTATGRLAHAVRHADGSWAGFEATGGPGEVARASIS